MRFEVNLGVIVAFSGGLTWIVTQRTRLESTPPHPRHSGGHNLFLEPLGLGLLILVDLALESLDLARPFSETNRVRLGYIVCPSTGGSVHEEEERRVVERWRMPDGASDFPHVPNRATWRCGPPSLSQVSMALLLMLHTAPSTLCPLSLSHHCSWPRSANTLRLALFRWSALGDTRAVYLYSDVRAN